MHITSKTQTSSCNISLFRKYSQKYVTHHGKVKLSELAHHYSDFSSSTSSSNIISSIIIMSALPGIQCMKAHYWSWQCVPLSLSAVYANSNSM
jgi:hypothetical protein